MDGVETSNEAKRLQASRVTLMSSTMRSEQTLDAHQQAHLRVVPVQREQQLPAVGVPVLQRAVLARREHVMRARHKRHLQCGTML